MEFDFYELEEKTLLKWPMQVYQNLPVIFKEIEHAIQNFVWHHQLF